MFFWLPSSYHGIENHLSNHVELWDYWGLWGYTGLWEWKTKVRFSCFEVSFYLSSFPFPLLPSPSSFLFYIFFFSLFLFFGGGHSLTL